jgi:predicted membrane-bound spermidine synthase
MNWHVWLRRTSLVTGLISLVLAVLTGMHLQHLLDVGSAQHIGESVGLGVHTLVFFGASSFGARRQSHS